MRTRSDTCRYCENLQDARLPRSNKHVGLCRGEDNDPDTCGKFELAACYEGHDPRKIEGGP